MAILAAAIGNAHTVLGLVEAGEVAHHWRVATDERRTSDEWAVLLRGLLGRHLDGVEGIAVCSAVPAVTRTWRTMLPRHLADLPVVVIEPGIRTGLAMALDNPREVGADRIANSLAALAEFGPPVVVVDFGGTATTYDVVNSAGTFVGGAITPGIEASLEALTRRGAQLRQVELVRPRTVVAKNTIEALQSGLIFGMAAQVDGMVDRIVEELGLGLDDVSVVATGYLAPVVLGECEVFTAHDPWLTLKGLEMVFVRNR